MWNPLHPARIAPLKHTLAALAVAILSTATLFAGDAGAEDESAFPGAAGWAARTPGGRGGRIIRVTTLAPKGPGSVAEAIASRGPRIIVFEVGGVIDLAGLTIRIAEPFLTIAGQTAPSPGITLVRGSFLVDTHDVVIQHLRVRPGTAGKAPKSGWEPDGLSTMARARDVIVDHCTFTWAVDENLSVGGKFFLGNSPEEWQRNAGRRITFSHNIVAEALSRSTHAKGEHSKGTLIMDNSGEVLLFGNLYASNVNRNPEIKGGASAAVINNFIYNPKGTAVNYHMTGVWKGRQTVIARNEVTGNVLRHGPDTPADLALFRFGGIGNLEFHGADNLAFTRDGKPARVLHEDNRHGGRLLQRDAPVYWPPAVRAMPAASVEAYVRTNAGARPWDRDPIDERIVRQALDGTGRIIDSEEQVGGYPKHEETRRPFNPGEWDLRTMVRSEKRASG